MMNNPYFLPLLILYGLLLFGVGALFMKYEKVPPKVPTPNPPKKGELPQKPTEEKKTPPKIPPSFSTYLREPQIVQDGRARLKALTQKTPQEPKNNPGSLGALLGALHLLHRQANLNWERCPCRKCKLVWTRSETHSASLFEDGSESPDATNDADVDLIVLLRNSLPNLLHQLQKLETEPPLPWDDILKGIPPTQPHRALQALRISKGIPLSKASLNSSLPENTIRSFEDGSLTPSQEQLSLLAPAISIQLPLLLQIFNTSPDAPPEMDEAYWNLIKDGREEPQ